MVCPNVKRGGICPKKSQPTIIKSLITFYFKVKPWSRKSKIGVRPAIERGGSVPLKLSRLYLINIIKLVTKQFYLLSPLAPPILNHAFSRGRGILTFSLQMLRKHSFLIIVLISIGNARHMKLLRYQDGPFKGRGGGDKMAANLTRDTPKDNAHVLIIITKLSKNTHLTAKLNLCAN